LQPIGKSMNMGKHQLIMLFFAFSLGMILANLLGNRFFQEESALSDNTVLISFRGEDKFLGDLPDDFAEAYLDLEEKTRKQKEILLENAALLWYLREHAGSRELSEQAAFQALFSEAQVSKEEVSTYYRENEALIGKPFHEVRNVIRSRLLRSRGLEARERVLNEMRKSGDLVILPDK